MAHTHTHKLAPTPHHTQHDYARGPYWPDELFDAAWCVEFTEHVGRMYQQVNGWGVEVGPPIGRWVWGEV